MNIQRNKFVKYGVRVMLVLLMVLMLTGLFTQPALAQDDDPTPPTDGEVSTPVDVTNLVGLLAWLAGPAGMMAWMVFLSNAVRNLREGDPSNMDPASSGLAGMVRKLTPLALQSIVTLLAFGVPGVAAVILATIPAEALATVQGTYSFIATLFIIYLGQQIWFQVTKPKPQPVASVTTEVSATGAQKTTAQVGGPGTESAQVAGLAPAPGYAVPK